MNSLAKAEILFESLRDDTPRGDLVTVAVSLYNYERFLRQCLDSVAAQKHSDLDIIIVDDHSLADASIECAGAWLAANASRFGRASLLRHLENQGLAQARNTAFQYARSDSVFVMDADNEIYPRAIARLVAALRETACQAAYTQLEFFGSEEGLGYADVWRPESFRQGNYVDAMALVAKAAWADVHGYTHIEGGWEDYDFWCKLVERNHAATYVPEILCRYRVHQNSMLRTETVKAARGLCVEMMLRHPWLRLKSE